MKRLILLFLFMASPAYAVDVSQVVGLEGLGGGGGGIVEGSDFGYGNITGTSIVNSGDLTVGGDILSTVTGSNSNFNLETDSTTLSLFGPTIYLTNQVGVNGVIIRGVEVDFYNDKYLAFSEDNTSVDMFLFPSGTKVASDRTMTFLRQDKFVINPEQSIALYTSGDNATVSVLQTYNSGGTSRDVMTYQNMSTVSEGSGGLFHSLYETEHAVVWSVDEKGTVAVGGGVAFSGQTTVTGTYSIPEEVYIVFANASTAAFTTTLPDTAGVDVGHVVVIKKDDPSINAITVDGFGSQTIDHSLTKIIRAHNKVITVMEHDGNWKLTQATPDTFYADMHVHDNLSTTTINTQNVFHAIRQFSDVFSSGFTFAEGSEGATTVFLDYSSTVPGTVLATDGTHGLSTGGIITLTGTTNYNDVFQITVVDADSFYFTDTFVADDATGNWYQGDHYTANPGTGGLYKAEFHTYGKPDAGTNQDYEFEFFIDTTAQENVEAARRFANSNDVGTLGGGGLVTIEDGATLWMGIQSTSGTQNFTFTHLNFVLHSL